jgi:radical SAM superfamily enzyme YgiQ (UPF0313 family)
MKNNIKLKRVMLIHPPGTVYGTGLLKPSIPMGLLYISTFLKSKKVEVLFLDCLAGDLKRVEKRGKGRRYGMSAKKISKKILEFKPDVVGIGNMFTAYFDDVVEMAKLVKRAGRKIKVVVGGSHVSVDPIEVIKNRAIDIAVYGEGEETMWEIVNNKRNLTKIKGIVFRDGKKIIKNEPRDLIKNLDTLPYPDWEVLDYSKYVMGSNFNMRKPVFPLISSRGCPGHCLYCSVNAVWQHRWRGRIAVNVVDEMEYLIKNFGAREFAFQDDSVSVDKKRLEEICDEMIKRKLDVKWTTPNGIAHWTLTKPLLKKMKEAGCYRITFGIESGDPELRRWVGKPYSLEQARDLTRYANSIGYWTLATNIIGFPYETKENIDNTFNFALKSDVDLAFFFRLGLRPGTAIFEIFKKEGWLIKDRHIMFSEDATFQTQHFSGEEVVAMQKRLYRNFLIRRWLNPLSVFRVVNKIRSWEDFTYILGIAVSGIKLNIKLLSTKKGVTSKVLKV